MIRAVIFDLDGTLVDSNEAHVTVWERVFAIAGRPVEAAAIRGQIGKGGDLLVPTLAPELDDSARKQASAQHGAMFQAEFLPRIRPFAGARALLRRVHASGCKVVIGSSASKAELRHYVDLLDAAEIVEAGTSIDDVDTSKPAADLFAAALEKAGVTAEEAVVVGDTPYDIAAAAKAGIATVAVRSGGFSDDALAGAVAVYDDAAALLAGFATSPLAR